MKSAVDSSLIVAALCAGNPDHESCRKVLQAGRHVAFTHALSETFSTLTGGRLGFRLPTSKAAGLIRQQIASMLRLKSLESAELFAAFDEAEGRGVRGGAIYDYLHLVAAREAGAKRLFTLNLADFLSFHRPGDPEIVSP